MPLMKRPSKKAFEHNIKAEMHAGKPQDQALAIAYDVKRRNAKKKMAQGGMVNESAKTEHRPMPDERDQAAKMISQNSGKKSLPDDQWESNVTVKQAQKPSIVKLSAPKIMGSDSFSVRDRKEIDKEKDLEMSARPNNGPQEQPQEEDNEMGADRQGPKVSDMERQHNNRREAYANGGMINEDVSMHDAEEDEVQHPAGLEEDNDEMSPAKDEYMANRFAEGGMIDDMDQPEPEEDEERHNSIAAAIMAKKDRESRLNSGSKDEDRMIMMAEGGQVDIDSNNEEQPNSYYARNEHAALKENYDKDMDGISQPMDSNLHGDEHEKDMENVHDMISSIRSKMNMRRQFGSK